MKEMGWLGFDRSRLHRGFWWQGKVEGRSWDRGGMGARSCRGVRGGESQEWCQADMGGRLHRRRTVGVVEAWLGGSGVRHWFMGRARCRGGLWGATALAEDGPGRGGGQPKGLLRLTRWTLTIVASNVRRWHSQCLTSQRGFKRYFWILA